MKSKTKIRKQVEKKRNPELVETVALASKNKKWFRVAEILASPRKNKIEKNLDSISNYGKENEIIVVPGKVLSMGKIDKAVNVAALSFSKSAEEKIIKAGGKVSSISEEIKKNPDAKDLIIVEAEK